MDGQTEKSKVESVNSADKKVLRETTFREQIQTLLAVERQLENRWVIQKLQFGEWCGIRVTSIIPDDPISETAPITGTATYATSGEALEAMQTLQARYPDVPMQVSPAEEDILAAQLSPGTSTERARFGQYPRWGELRLKFPELFNGRMHSSSCH